MQALELLTFQELSAPELADALQVHLRTARRLLVRLAFEGYISEIPGWPRRYSLTLRLAAMGRQAIARAQLPQVAAPIVAALATKTEATAHLWMPCYRDVICLLRCEPDGGREGTGPMLGESVPAHASAAGKVLLAHRRAWRVSVLAWPLERHTDRTITDTAELSDVLAVARNRGYATDRGEHARGSDGIAAPVFLRGDAIAALGVTVDGADLDGIDDPVIARIAHFAATLSAALDAA
jgi:DNA-binding IclR family transcriptional regulator